MTTVAEPAYDVLWRANPGQQHFALRATGIRELLYGGARGGGKTDCGIIWLVKPPWIHWRRYRALVIRRNAEDLSDWLDRAERLYAPLGGVVYRSNPQSIRFPSGAVIRLGHLKDGTAYTKYQGHEYQKMLLEELTQIPRERDYIMLAGSCRTHDPNYPAEIFLTANPGGVGHRWVYSRFRMGANKPNMAYPIPGDGRLQMFVPATIEDNPKLREADPNYEKFLESLPEQLRRAWRYGDWSAFEGQMFQFGQDHILADNPSVPADAVILHTFDWGFGKPFSAGWWYVQQVPESEPQLVRFAEYYGAMFGDEDKGLRLIDEEIAEKIVDTEQKLGIAKRDIIRLGGRDLFAKKPDYFARAGGGQGPSSAEVFGHAGLDYKPGDDRSRIAKIRRFHAALRVERNDQGALLRPPRLLVAPRCLDFIRTIPVLVSDVNDPEDVDTRQEDHVYDEACHAVMWRPTATMGTAAQPTRTPPARSWSAAGRRFKEKLHASPKRNP